MAFDRRRDLNLLKRTGVIIKEIYLFACVHVRRNRLNRFTATESTAADLDGPIPYILSSMLLRELEFLTLI